MSDSDSEKLPVTYQSELPIDTTHDYRPAISFTAFVGLNEAARLTGVHKPTIVRDVKAGRLSYTTDERGNKRYQVAELDRLYRITTGGVTDVTSNVGGNNYRLIPPHVTSVTTPDTTELAVLKERLAAREDTIRRLEQEHARALGQIDELRNDKRILQTLIEAKKEAPPQRKTGKDTLNDGQGAQEATSRRWYEFWRR